MCNIIIINNIGINYNKNSNNVIINMLIDALKFNTYYIILYNE